MLVSTANCGEKCRNLGRGSNTAEAYSSPSKTKSRPLPRITMHDWVGFPRACRVGGGMALAPFEAGFRQYVRRGRVSVPTRAGDLIAQLLGDHRQPRYGIAADADEMDAHQELAAASSK